MDFTLKYYLMANWVLLLVVVFYRLVLARMNRFHWNRAYLLLGSLGAFLVPLMKFPSSSEVLEGFSLAAALPEVAVGAESGNATSGLAWSDLLIPLYLVIAGLFILWFGIRTFRLLTSIWRSPRETRDEYTLVRIPNIKGPASFLHYLIWSPELDDSSEKSRFILAHEKCHIRERHTLDLIWMEILTAACWLNPAVWLLRSDLRRTHEYLADQAAVKASGHNPLRKIILESHFGTTGIPVVNHFQSQIKARLMMSESNSKPRQVWRYFLVLPMVFLAIACSRVDTEANELETLKTVEGTPAVVDVNTVPHEKEGNPGIDDFPGSDTEMPAPLNMNEVAEKMGYPKEAKDKKIEGKVIVRLLVDQEGAVEEHKVLKYADASLRSAVEKHVYDLKFKPGQKDGKAVKVWVTLPFSFKL